MEIVRDYKYDNIKCFMIFFVVFAHLLEMLNGKISNTLYILIYTFHMPIFAYVSGYFSKGNMKSIKKFIYIYLIWQSIFYLFDVIVLNKNIKFSLTLPNWTLWYIFAMIFWNLIIKFIDRFSDKFSANNYLYILLISIVISLLAGYFNEIGYEFSASRIITFFPYFLLGYINRNINIKKENLKIHKYKNWIIAIFLIIAISYFFVNFNIIRHRWLYGSYSYQKGRI